MAIPEVRCKPGKEHMGIKNLKKIPTFFIGNSQKIKHFPGHKDKEDLGIPQNFDHFLVKNMGILNFAIFDIKKNWKFPFFFFFWIAK